ncbi:Murein DD-endopeptidase MepM and murein hydrolase activator NlpD, contain LysM domain [Natronincola peptidivorans]|uniref:Murein DD-endopeptidase MepM and murein hydrolase activator NlpD, contain LysM domain n=1 Tax=Natronincola peptidivorans TaxID=426128 RepID=A0A1I0B4F0_9FIRM|nr:M23 family metallopeptidase [Natronincola peptidivorans]SET01575.1 Murein DD-endopeptidase MepM and murein hydrolase activator NlpD, contain LysM domain [Natronincola peptidivorans]
MEINQRILRVYKELVNRITQLSGKKLDKKVFTYTAVGLVLIILGVILNSSINASLRAYEVQMDGSVLATIRSEEDFEEAIEEVKEEILALYGHEFVVPTNITLVETKAKQEDLTDINTIIYNIKRQLDMKVKAISIKVDGQVVAYVKDQATADKILEDIKGLYISEDKEYDFIGFRENVVLEEAAVEIKDIRNKEDVYQLITQGTDEEQIHEVAAGESAWVIARKYDLSVEDIEAANPGINPERLQIGQKLSLIVPKPYITVQTKEYVELIEAIPFETERVETDSLYRGDQRITVQGIEGEREIKGYLIKENGVLADRDILEEIILSEPKTRVIAEGTKPRPATVATGTFANPTRGRLTSGFGTRWGRRHEGIDLAAPTGTSITAADAGRVSFAGYQGSYGNLVIIDHENGYQTYYAHCSRILVKVGTRVFKGQEIAKVGSTGNSTGPHLHFEVRRNGVPVNPLQFVRY